MQLLQWFALPCGYVDMANAVHVDTHVHAHEHAYACTFYT